MREIQANCKGLRATYSVDPEMHAPAAPMNSRFPHCGERPSGAVVAAQAPA